MKVKKFICKRCQAPKVTKIETAYVVCDYCASLMDVDLTIGHKEYYADAEKVEYYESNKLYLNEKAEEAFQEGDKEAFYNYKFEFWKMYLETYPEYIIPSVTPKLFDKWCDVCAKSDSYFRFKTYTEEEIAIGQSEENNYNIEFYEIGENRYATWDSFINATKIYYREQKKSNIEMRSVPELSFMEQVYPLDIAIKKGMSMYAQMWLPYLEEKYHDTFLEYIGLKTEYIDIPPVEITEKACGHCNELIQVPEGAIRSKCTNCNSDNTWTNVVCTSCGAENELPEDWQETISCKYCTSETRVINKLFG